MRRLAVQAFGALVMASGAFAQSSGSPDIVLKAMRDELTHSQALATVNLEKPYFISYQIEDGEAFSATATLGGIVVSSESHFRVPVIQVRVGDYQFDNTNYVGSHSGIGSRYDINPFPTGNLYPVLRRFLWLGTDQTYKGAVESMARKRAALKNVSAGEQIPDFAHAEPTKWADELATGMLDHPTWLARVRSLSAIFTGFPEVLLSDVEMQAVKDVRRLADSEGTEVRTADEMLSIRVRAAAQASDGMRLRDSAVFQTFGFDRAPGEPDLRELVRSVAANVTALKTAPAGETYNGPVLFEGVAAAQLFAQLLGRNLALPRRPVNEPGRPNSFPASELEGRQGALIMPEWMSAVDDPTQKEYRGRRLFGTYAIDYEGVAAKPLVMVEKGELKNFALTRQPVAGFTASNGRARLPGSFGAATAAISNLFIRAEKTSSLEDLRKNLMAICRKRNLEYGMIVRKLDFPSSAPLDELRRMMAAGARDGGSQLISPPILIYKVFPDGKEELIRGVHFRDLNARSMRDIRAAANDSNVLDYMENGAPLALMGAGSYVAESSVIAPSVLLDDVAIRKVDEEQPKLPVVPPPAMAGK